jgi:transposase-like protein
MKAEEFFMEKKKKTNELVKQLMENEGVNDVVGLQSILKDMLKQGVENLLTSELDEELGYNKYDRTKDKDNYRNGYSKKTVRSDLGELDINIPRDRNNDYEHGIGNRPYRERKNGFHNFIFGEIEPENFQQNT